MTRGAPHMYRFVPLTEHLYPAVDPEDVGPGECGIFDTVTDRFLECNGWHALSDLGEVWDAAGERGCNLVPDGFFPNDPTVTASTPGFEEYLLKRLALNSIEATVVGTGPEWRHGLALLVPTGEGYRAEVVDIERGTLAPAAKENP